jgi:hypothetical protein
MLMQAVYEIHQVLGLAVSTGGGKVSGSLIAPRTIEGVLHDRKEFNVGEAETVEILGQFGCQFPIIQRTIAFFRHPHP